MASDKPPSFSHLINISNSCNECKSVEIANHAKFGNMYHTQKSPASSSSKSPVQYLKSTIQKLKKNIDEESLLFHVLRSMLFVKCDDWILQFTSVDEFKTVKQPWGSFMYQISSELQSNAKKNKIRIIQNRRIELENIIGFKNEYLGVMNSAVLPLDLMPHGILCRFRGSSLFLNEYQELEITKFVATIKQNKEMERRFAGIFMQHLRWLMKSNVYKQYSSINLCGIDAWYKSTKRINSRKRKYDDSLIRNDIHQNKRPKLCDVLPTPLPPPYSMRRSYYVQNEYNPNANTLMRHKKQSEYMIGNEYSDVCNGIEKKMNGNSK